MNIIPATTIIETPIDGENAKAILKIIEAAGRTCYKSECKISETSASDFVRKIVHVNKHESVIEHGSATVRFIVDRGVSHELVRHRLAAFSQESTRYCLAGDTKLTTKNPHAKLSLKSLYENRTKSPNGAWKKILIKNYNEDTATLEFTKINDIFLVGKKPTYKLKTRLGYEIVATEDHEILCEDGFLPVSSLGVGNSIACNGTSDLYLNKDWLSNQYINENKTSVQIANDFGFNVSTIKKWVKKHNLPSKPMSYWKVGAIPWNKGLNENNDSRVATQAATLRANHWNGGHLNVYPPKSERIMKLGSQSYRKTVSDKCWICSSESNLQVHHIDENRDNNKENNLATLCPSCHQALHNKNLQTLIYDDIISKEYVGEQDVFDLSVSSEHKNFVANGVIVHNCNYSKEGFGGSITLIDPILGFALQLDNPVHISWYKTWYEVMEKCEWGYLKLTADGAPAQFARDVLPNSLKTEVVMTCNMREWRHVFRMRCSKAAHPQIREVMIPLLRKFQDALPELFGDIVVES